MLLLLACADPAAESEKTPSIGDSAGTEDSAADTDAGDTGDSTGDTEDSTAPDPCAEDVPRPPAVSFPSTIGTLTVTIRNGDGFSDGTDDETLQLCLRDDRCFDLGLGDGAQLDATKTGVWSFEDVALDRADVDQVTLRTADGGNQWQPACMDLRFDGEPVYCAELGMEIGDGGGESTSWTDPDGLHQDCGTCWDGPLTHGPMIGAVTPETARVWLRTDATRDVALKLDGRVAAWAQPAAEDDLTDVLVAECLEPGRDYDAEIEIDGASVWSGTVRTPPADGAADAWRFAFGSCTRWDDQPIFSTIAATDPAMFLFIGDNDYANTDDLDVARHWYRWGFDSPERAAFLARTPTVATWDDHDFTGDDSDGTAAKKADALRAFSEYWANPAFGQADLPGVFFSMHRGDVDLFVLDDGYYRDLDGTMLGEEQQAWLLDGLAASTATFKLIASGSVWNEDGNDDSWDDFLDERADIFAFIRDHGIDGVVLLSGDVHRAEIRELASPGSYDLPELVSSPLANLPTLCGSSSELIACYDGGDAWIQVDIDTTVADPVLSATILDVDGGAQGAATWRLSELTAP